MPSNTTTTLEADLTAVQDFPRRAEAAMKEIHDMMAACERLEAASHPWAGWIATTLDYSGGMPHTREYMAELKEQ